MYTTFWEWAREQNPEPFVVPHDAPGVAPEEKIPNWVLL